MSTKKINEGDQLMNIDDVAEYLKLSRKTIQRYVFFKQIPFLKIGKHIRFKVSDILKWVDQNRAA